MNYLIVLLQDLQRIREILQGREEEDPEQPLDD